MSDLPSVYKEDGDLIIRASSIGRCVKELVLIGLGVEGELPDEKLQQMFSLGHEAEAMVKEKLVADGFIEVQDEQAVASVVVANGLVVRGHTDGLV